MPSYDYRCDANGLTIEVRHGMSQVLNTWGELCAALGVATGDTAPETPVRKVISGAGVVRSENLGSGSAPPCESGMGACCGGGSCRM